MTTILVAGADTAVATMVAERLAGVGAPVLLTPADPGGALPGRRTDPTDPDSVREAIVWAGVELGPPSAAVALPSAAPDRPVHQLDEDLWRTTLDGNLTSAMHLARAAAPAIADAGGGTIVFVTWRADPGAGRSHLAAAAGAVEMLARALAVELGPARIRSNAVAVPLGGVAAAVPALRLLLSPEAGYLTGEVLDVGRAAGE